MIDIETSRAPTWKCAWCLDRGGRAGRESSIDIIPSVLGGPENQMIGRVIATNIITTSRWEFAGAVASVLFAISLAMFLAFYRMTAGPRRA